MDLVVIPREDAYLFLTGPDVVREVTGEDVSFSELGGSRVAERSGLAAPSVSTRRRCSCLRTRAAVLPAVARRSTPAPVERGGARRRRSVGGGRADAAKATYDVRTVLERIVDVGSFRELRGGGARNMCVGFARLEGRPIGVIANQPRFSAGSIDIDASRKGAWFVEIAIVWGCRSPCSSTRPASFRGPRRRAVE